MAKAKSGAEPAAAPAPTPAEAPAAVPAPAVPAVQAAADAAAPPAAPQSTAVATVADLEDGMYFGLDESVYHSLPRIGSTSLKHLLTSGPQFWWKSWLNVDFAEAATEAETDALKSGTALHKIILEGEEAFAAAYALAPDKSAPGMLDTIADMKAWLTARGIAFKASAPKPEFIALIQVECAKTGEIVPIYDVIIEALKASGRQIIKPALYNRCMITSRFIQINPWLTKCFQDGYPEVSILWTEIIKHTHPETGVVTEVKARCKARIDYLKLRANVDLKTLANQGSRPLDVSVTMAIAGYRYDTQFAHYMTAREKARELVKAGHVFDLTGGRTIRRRVLKDTPAGQEWVTADEPMMPPKWWLDDFVKRPFVGKTPAKKDGFTWIWVMVQKTGAPESKGYEYHVEGPLERDPAFASRRFALHTFAHGMVTHGAGIWGRVDPIERITADNLPQWIRDEIPANMSDFEDEGELETSEAAE